VDTAPLLALVRGPGQGPQLVVIPLGNPMGPTSTARYLEQLLIMFIVSIFKLLFIDSKDRYLKQTYVHTPFYLIILNFFIHYAKVK
jgi:hypothetical protein